jgi:hypothetical protein
MSELDSLSTMPAPGSKRLIRIRIGCGVVAGPLFVASFTAIGSRRGAYDWRRHAVSSLAAGRGGWSQRANFMLAGALYCIAAGGVARSPKPAVGPVAIPMLIFGAGAGLIGSGLFVTDPVAGFPPSSDGQQPNTPTRGGSLHNLCAIPIFLGIPAAAMIAAASSAAGREYRWGAYSAASAIAMMSTSMLFGAGFSGTPSLARWGGAWQRISIAIGCGWLSALSARALISTRVARMPDGRRSAPRRHRLEQ